MTARPVWRGRSLGAATVLAVVGTVLAGCAMWGPEGGPGGAGLKGPVLTSSAPPVDAVAGPDGVQRIDISAGDDLRFTPSVVLAHPGVIEFVFHDTGTTPHDVELDVLDTSGPAQQSTVDNGEPGTGNLNGGQSGTVRITVSKPGTYPFPCLYHVSSGMQGTLVVSP